jgi:hypothetical protein
MSHKANNDLTDGEVLTLYSLWSEETHAAGFLHPDPDNVTAFISWLDTMPSARKVTEDYEIEMLLEFRYQMYRRRADEHNLISAASEVLPPEDHNNGC